MSERAIFFALGKALVEGHPQAGKNLRLTRPALRAIPMLRDAGFDLVVVAHEPGIALGTVSEEDVDRERRRLEDALRQLEATLAGFYYCPHDPSGKVPAYAVDCVCRRPQPGLITRAASDLGTDLATSWVIGEMLDDVEAGRRAGCRPVLVDTGSETEWRITRYRVPHFLTGDLAKAARVILAAERNPSHNLGAQQAS